MASRYRDEKPLNPLARVSPGLPRMSLPSSPRPDPLAQRMIASVQHVRQGDVDVANRPRSLRERLFGTKGRREKRLEELDYNRTDAVCTLLEKEIALQCEALYLRCKDEVDNWLVAHRITSRRELIEAVTAQLDELKATIEDRRVSFNATVRRRMERLQDNQDMELLVDAEIEDMRSEIVEHLAFLRQLEEHFRAAVKERIG
jgi:hypothetical protein